MNLWPGAGVIIKSGLASTAARWGVTPQAQKTGVTPWAMACTAAP
jgi:hypothetical protein